MKRKLLILIAAFLTYQSPMLAQSMTDSQLINYVKTEMEKGTPQQTIIQNLIKRGVTTTQLQRVRRKVEAEQKQLGATDLTGKQEVERQRTGSNDKKETTKSKTDKKQSLR